MSLGHELNIQNVFKYILVGTVFLIFIVYQAEFIGIVTDSRSVSEYITVNSSGSKWIVVTSIQYPTEDVKRLVDEPGWNIVVVADEKTPRDWKYPSDSGVYKFPIPHFLSIEKQRKLFPFSRKLPFNSYTRKNLGYLYAIMNGAQWIYDTDDDNKPYGLGLQQFEYSCCTSGLRYIAKNNSTLEEKLFNPYTFYGLKDIWPRGFPLEYLEGHTNGKDRMLSCRYMKAPAVQQGIVHNDPDVDAIYRLLHADKSSGLRVKFNEMAAPIVLEQGTYAPWNSQNTLFEYRAFFILFLPTTVDFRVTDIWRSFFGQKLLHLIGEQIGFVPVNAVQYRNPHSFLKDFHQEIDVYEKSGAIIEFLDGFDCSKNSVEECTIQLAEEFVCRKFFGAEDGELINDWIQALKEVGYKFPPLVRIPLLSQQPREKFGNCREANLDMSVDSYDTVSDKENDWALKSLNTFTEILNWCNVHNDTLDYQLPSPEEFLKFYENNTAVSKKKDAAFVLINNYPWKTSIGLLQRLYLPFFKHIIFCGTWNPDVFAEEELKPIYPISYINMTTDEMSTGYNYGWCISKVRDLRLQNVSGYYFVSDDSGFNFWNELPLDTVVNPRTTIDDKFWWRDEFINKSLELIEGKYKDDYRIQHTWHWFQQGILKKYGQVDTRMNFIQKYKSCLSDFFYLPWDAMNFFGDMMEVFAEAHVMVESAMGKLLDIIEYVKGGPEVYLWGPDRITYYVYNKTQIVLHPIKTSGVHNITEQRQRYCESVVKFIGEEAYGAEIKVVPKQ